MRFYPKLMCVCLWKFRQMAWRRLWRKSGESHGYPNPAAIFSSIGIITRPRLSSIRPCFCMWLRTREIFRRLSFISFASFSILICTSFEPAGCMQCDVKKRMMRCSRPLWQWRHGKRAAFWACVEMVLSRLNLKIIKSSASLKISDLLSSNRLHVVLATKVRV